MLNVLLVFISFQCALTLGFFLTQSVSSATIFALFHIGLLVSLFIYYRGKREKNALIGMALLCVISTLYFGFEFSRAFNNTSRTFQVLNALMMNSSMVLGILLIVFGLWNNTKMDNQ